ncbi:hypothetical protein [Lacinutrix chionoecetis]
MKLPITLLFFLSITLAFSQKEMTAKSDWSVVHDEESNFTISKRSVDIDDMQNGLFKAYYQYKFENKTNKQLFLSWHFITDYKNFSNTKSANDENYRVLLLEPNATYIPDFSKIKDKSFFVFTHFNKRQSNIKLNTVEFSNLKFKSL